MTTDVNGMMDIQTNKSDLDIQHFTDMIPLANQSAALEFLLTVKSGLRNYAIALTELATPEARDMVRRQLNEGLDIHAKLSDVMISKGWLHPYKPDEQFVLDVKSAEVTRSIAGMSLFKDRSKVLDTFDVPSRTDGGGML